ncbi:ribosomal protein uL6 [Cardinium endosymbiont of Sogatella furcifera]|uniref:50S ribosomal protein L6 n=1 Tax=Cardinium endosymbiont of Sogatella furcifera TaxID=650378 RepID=UPI000E0D8652|nr:50S ribosomal protein L6 [Cardinium endosymbiont of Sogatella furcifera]AXI24505.1 ribosomal protein uL6 [Cardinium endosymbiont of Sogatella furcifera]
MSRIGKQPIHVPSGVVVSTIDGGIVEVKGAKGILRQQLHPAITVEIAETLVKIIPVDLKKSKALYGLYRALIQNMVVGVSVGFKSTLELVGVGYKASVQGKLLELSLGYSHDIVLVLPEEVTATAELPKGKSPLVHLACMDKQLLGQVAAKIRSLRKVEPYKGKGVRFLGEQVRRKVGKSTKK